MVAFFILKNKFGLHRNTYYFRVMELKKEIKKTFTYRAKPSVVKAAKAVVVKKNKTISETIEAYLERIGKVKQPIK